MNERAREALREAALHLGRAYTEAAESEREPIREAIEKIRAAHNAEPGSTLTWPNGEVKEGEGVRTEFKAVRHFTCPRCGDGVEGDKYMVGTCTTCGFHQGELFDPIRIAREKGHQA